MAASPPAVPSRIFISYRREETAYPAAWLFDRLASHFRAGQVFKDVDSIQLGDDFVEEITRAVASCDVLLALIGERWLTIADEQGRRRLDLPDDFVRLEIEAALTRNVRVIPILVDGARMPDPGQLPDSLARLVRRQALQLSPERFDFDLNRLLRVLDQTLAEVRTGQLAAVPAKPPPAVRDPGVAGPRQPGPKVRRRDAPARPRRRLRRSRILAGVGVALVPLLALALVLRPQPRATVPDPGDASVAEAVALLRRAGLTVVVTREANKAVAVGKVVRMTPPPGTRTRRGARVLLVASSGPKVTPLPADMHTLVVGYVDHVASSETNPGAIVQDFDPILFADPNTGRAQGLDVDLANELGKRLQVQVQFKDIRHFTRSFLSLDQGQVDITISVLRDAANIREDVDLVDYLVPGSAVLIPESNPDQIDTLQDLCGRTVVRPIEMAPGSIVNQSHSCQKAGQPPIALMSCPSRRFFKSDRDLDVPLRTCRGGVDPLQLVIDRQVAAAVLDLPVADQLLTRPDIGQQLRIASRVESTPPYAIAIKKGNNRVKEPLRSALQALISDGTYQRLLVKWGLEDLALKATP
jgi:ABC-type amino acid transport substrate-binding protein